MQFKLNYRAVGRDNRPVRKAVRIGEEEEEEDRTATVLDCEIGTR